MMWPWLGGEMAETRPRRDQGEGAGGLPPLETLYDRTRGAEVPLPAELLAVYGPLRLPSPPGRPYIISTFVTTLDGVVAWNGPGQSGGGEISGRNPHDRLVMGLLRAVADAVVVGAGTLRTVPRHVWTAERVYPPLAEAYGRLRAALGKPAAPLNVIVTASGRLDPDLPVFRSGQVPALVVATAEGVRGLQSERLPPWVRVAAVEGVPRVPARRVLQAIPAGPGQVVLVEGGPHLLGDFLAEGCLDELFLTLSPQIAGRDGSVERPGLVAGRSFAPDRPLWGTLLGVKRAGDHLFLRYAPGSPRPAG